MFDFDEAPDKPVDWDPMPHERVWYSWKPTGDRGWLVVRDGVDCVRLDRPNHELIKPLSECRKENEHRPLTAYDVAQVAHAADRVLCRVLQLYAEPRKEWIELKEEERIRWCNEGPKHPKRALMYACIRETLKDEVG